MVALGEGAHGNEQGHAFRLSLIRDPRFPATVNDIVVESGNARYQDLMDRFVGGGNVAEDALRQVWQNTTQPQAVERPITEEFFRAVRAVNASLPRERQLRVLLGDPPIDWDAVHSVEDHRKWMDMRDTYPADLIAREVLARQRRALVVYGDMHLQRKQLLGPADFTFYYPSATARFAFQDGRLAPIPRAEWRSLRMDDQFDALLYLGPPSTITFSRLSPALCADPAYMKMRLGRLALVGPPAEADRLRQYCATVAPK